MPNHKKHTPKHLQTHSKQLTEELQHFPTLSSQPLQPPFTQIITHYTLNNRPITPNNAQLIPIHNKQHCENYNKY